MPPKHVAKNHHIAIRACGGQPTLLNSHTSPLSLVYVSFGNSPMTNPLAIESFGGFFYESLLCIGCLQVAQHKYPYSFMFALSESNMSG